MKLTDLRFPDTRSALAFAIVAMLAGEIAARIYVPGFKGDDPIISVVRDAFLIVVGWYFGSSKSSAAKDATISALAQPQDPTNPS